jgi:DNA primase
MFPREVIQLIRDRVDIAQVVGQSVTLTRKGNSLMGLCPFHQEKSPSFSVVPSKGIYHCFGCGESGDVFRFLQKTRGMSFSESVRDLAQVAGVAIEERVLTPEERRKIKVRAGLQDVIEAARSHFHSNLMTSPDGEEARRYLLGRGIFQETWEKWKLGYALNRWDGLLNWLHGQGIDPHQAIEAGLARRRDKASGAYDLFRGRVMIPIDDSRGKPVAFGGRVLPGTGDADSPKYVNSPETEIYKKSHLLFGLNAARNAIARTGHMLVVEGYFDVISLHQGGFAEAVATCGTALTSEHAAMIRPITQQVIALFDADEAGERAATRSMDLFLEKEIEARRLDIRPAKDPDEFIQKFGADEFQKAIDRSVPLYELVLNRAVTRHGTSAGARERVLEELTPVLRKLPSAGRAALTERLGARLGIPEGAVKAAMGRPISTPASAPAPRRWVGEPDLNHLLWVLLHFPSISIPLLIDQVKDPEMVSDRRSALIAIGLLMEGKSLPEVIDSVNDDDLAHILRAVSAKEGLYKEEQVAGAVSQIVARMEEKRIRGELQRIGEELESCKPGVEGERYLSLLRAKQEIQRRSLQLKERARGGGS